MRFEEAAVDTRVRTAMKRRAECASEEIRFSTGRQLNIALRLQFRARGPEREVHATHKRTRLRKLLAIHAI
jgi:hypothetical protein